MKGIFHMLSMNLSRRPASETKSEQAEDDLQANIDELIPDNYREATGDTVPLLEIVKDCSQSTDRSEGVDPYNTGSFDAPKK